MTAGISQTRKHRTSLGLSGHLLGVVSLAAAWTVTFAGVAPSAFADDTQSKQWYLGAMQAEEMWKTSTGSGIKIAVIDTGVNPSTPSLEGQVLKGVDATGAKGDETDDYDGHGTTMAELIAGTGRGGGLKGLAPGAKIMPMRVADADWQTKEKLNPLDTTDAIRAAAESDAKIISMSFGNDFALDEEREAVKYAQSKGKLFFASVGNEAKKGNPVRYPAAYEEVVGVASADREGKVAEYSQNGSTVDIAAPGNDIPRWCDSSFQSYCDGDGGTSAATAIASASAALVWSAHPDWTANQVLNVLFDTASRDWEKDTVSKYLGHGLIRPSMNILKGKGDPGDPDVSPLTNEKTSGSAGSAAPSASASSQPDDKAEAGDATMAGSSAETDGGDRTGLIVGGVAVVLVLGGAAFVFARKRRAS
ncbi:S8 family serine peptidase [Streptomyces sp. NPDC048301]|uniref:S8 family serine peptidase n=1 Tax=Streptomyces sp. NPDC048301 TaxID=3155631 RepID=UPI0034129ACC